MNIVIDGQALYIEYIQRRLKVAIRNDAPPVSYATFVQMWNDRASFLQAEIHMNGGTEGYPEEAKYIEKLLYLEQGTPDARSFYRIEDGVHSESPE